MADELVGLPFGSSPKQDTMARNTHRHQRTIRELAELNDLSEPDMAKPYFLVCYGHTMRISDRCDTEAEALKDTFGTRFNEGVTCERRTGPSWAYISGKKKREIIIALAQKHYD